MRSATLMFVTLLSCALPSYAQGPYQSSQPSSDSQDRDTDDRDSDRDDRDRDDRDRDRPMSRQEIRERRRELKEQERELAQRERDARERRLERLMTPRAWIGVGAGGGWANIDETPCGASSTDCSGLLATYNANLTITGPFTAVRLRAVREQDKKGNQRTPWEEAALVGARFGHSNWYGLLGYGRILHPHDNYTQGDARGLAWEIVFAPSSYSAMGLELSFGGNEGNDVSYFTANVGARFGLLR